MAALAPPVLLNRGAGRTPAPEKPVGQVRPCTSSPHLPPPARQVYEFDMIQSYRSLTPLANGSTPTIALDMQSEPLGCRTGPCSQPACKWRQTSVLVLPPPPPPLHPPARAAAAGSVSLSCTHTASVACPAGGAAMLCLMHGAVCAGLGRTLLRMAKLTGWPLVLS